MDYSEKSKKKNFQVVNKFRKVATEEWGFQSNFVFCLCVTLAVSFDVNG